MYRQWSPLSNYYAALQYTIEEGWVVISPEVVWTHGAGQSTCPQKITCPRVAIEQAKQLEEAFQDAAVNCFNSSAHHLPDIKIGSHVTVQGPKIKLWDAYGIIKSHQQHYVKTDRNLILVHISGYTAASAKIISIQRTSQPSNRRPIMGF